MYLYAQGEWKEGTSVLDKAKTDKELCQCLETLGFRQYQEFVYRGGNARLYVREGLPGKGQSPIPFEFCCLLYLGKFLYAVGLKSLKDVMDFLREIDAHVKEPSSVIITNLDTFQRGISEDLLNLTERLEEPSVTIRNIAGLKNSIDQLVAALTGVKELWRHNLQPIQTPAASASTQNGAVPSSSQGGHNTLTRRTSRLVRRRVP